MALAIIIVKLFVFLSAFIFASAAKSHVSTAPFKPYSLVLPLRKDRSTSLHVAYIQKRTPRVAVPVVLDLSGRFLWVNCSRNYLSSTFNSPRCRSTQCSTAGVHYCHQCSSKIPNPVCHDNGCAVITTNPVAGVNALGEIAQDVVSIQSINNPRPREDAASGTSTSTRWVTIPRFIFACAPSSLLKGQLPRAVQGIAGLGHTPVSLPMQLASYFEFRPEFALCLPPDSQRLGGVFFGRIPSSVKPKSLAYTPLTISTQGEYLISVKSITVNKKPIPISRTSTATGATEALISTTTPYTVLERSIFKNLTQSFAHQLIGVPQVKAVAPFGLCFDARRLTPARVGPIPDIDFIMQNRNVSWTVKGWDSLVRVGRDVSCLGFVDGGMYPRASIVIGAYQIEHYNFLHFDLPRSRLGFVPSRFTQPINCTSFEFSSPAAATAGLDIVMEEDE